MRNSSGKDQLKDRKENIIMTNIFKSVSEKQKNTKVGLTIHLDQQENKEPFEVTVYFKKPENEASNEEVISITASGKLTFNIGGQGRLELFGESTNVIKELEAQEGINNALSEM
jgi:hypothetical protein